MKVIIYADASGAYRWRAIAPNGRIIADGGEGYESPSNATRAVRSVQEAFDELTDDDITVKENTDPPPFPPMQDT